MPAHCCLKVSDSHDTLKSSIVHGSFSALGIERNATHTFLTTSSPHGDLLALATLHPNHKMDPEPDTLKSLCSMPAIHQYKIPEGYYSNGYRAERGAGNPRTQW